MGNAEGRPHSLLPNISDAPSGSQVMWAVALGGPCPAVDTGGFGAASGPQGARSRTGGQACCTCWSGHSAHGCHQGRAGGRGAGALLHPRGSCMGLSADGRATEQAGR